MKLSKFSKAIPLIALILLSVTLQTPTRAGQNASMEPGLRGVDYFVNHTSIDPFYTNNAIDPGVLLHIREVVARGRERTAGKDNKIILLIHGSTFPASVAFDLPGGSMMQALARAGWDVFALDLEGYGESTRPPSMDHPALYAGATAPVGPAVSLADVVRAVDFIRDLRGVEKVHLLGWSAGAMNEVPRFPSTIRRKREKSS